MLARVSRSVAPRELSLALGTEWAPANDQLL